MVPGDSRQAAAQRKRHQVDPLRLQPDDLRRLDIVRHGAHRLAPLRPAQQQLDGDRGGAGNDERDDLCPGEEERPDQIVAAGEDRGGAACVDPEDELRHHL